MDDFPAVNVLILTENPANARCWANWLSAIGGMIWLRPAEVPEGSRVDLVLADAPLQDPLLRRHFAANRLGEIGVIQMGGTGPADAVLSADVTERELRLTCRLLAEVVRLRRQLNSRAAAQRKLLRAAMTDPLTGLPNRRAWERAIRRRFSRPGLQRSLCVALLDLDHFKQVNDTWGYAAGDALLRAVAGGLVQGLRKSDFVARIGGDEFGLLLLVPDPRTAEMIIERVRMQLPDFLANHGVQPITASAGFCVAEPGTPLSCPNDLLAAAGQSLREAKRSGRDRTIGTS